MYLSNLRLTIDYIFPRCFRYIFDTFPRYFSSYSDTFPRIHIAKIVIFSVLPHIYTPKYSCFHAYLATPTSFRRKTYHLTAIRCIILLRQDVASVRGKVPGHRRKDGKPRRNRTGVYGFFFSKQRKQMGFSSKIKGISITIGWYFRQNDSKTPLFHFPYEQRKVHLPPPISFR